MCPVEGNATRTDECEGVFTQFVVIAIVDLIVALLYTVQLLMRLQYTFFLCFKGHGKKVCVQ